MVVLDGNCAVGCGLWAGLEGIAPKYIYCTVCWIEQML